MRYLLFLLPIALVAQTATTPPAAKPKVAARTSTAAKRPTTSAKAAPTLTTDDEKTIYALGLQIYRSLGAFNLTPKELEIVKQALSDAQAKKPAEPIETWGPKIKGLADQRQAKVASDTLDKAAAQAGAVKTESGLVYKETTPGTGPAPAPTDTVRVNYRGTLPDGTEFDSSFKRNEPAEFPLNRVIKCWTEGLQKMKVGGKATLVCPAALAYGDEGRPGIPPGSVLTFEVELLAIPAAPLNPGGPSSSAPPTPGTPQ